MPTYGYKCLSCLHSLEIFQKIIEPPLFKCPQCNKNDLKRGPGGGSATIFSGGGWYKDGYNSSSFSVK